MTSDHVAPSFTVGLPTWIVPLTLAAEHLFVTTLRPPLWSGYRHGSFNEEVGFFQSTSRYRPCLRAGFCIGGCERDPLQKPARKQGRYIQVKANLTFDNRRFELYEEAVCSIPRLAIALAYAQAFASENSLYNPRLAIAPCLRAGFCIGK